MQTAIRFRGFDMARRGATVRRACAWLLVALALVLGSGCQHGPDRDELQSQVQTKLDGQFGSGVFRIHELVRRGSYPYQEEGDERDRLLVYYNAEIRLLRDYRLSNWDQLNVGSLISVLGANPRGVQGVKPEGNRAGEVLSVHGSSAYVRADDAWQLVAHRPVAVKQAEPRPGAEELPPYRQRIEELAKVAKQLQRRNRKREIQLLEKDLDRVLFAAERRLARSRGWITIATGTAEGEYYALGKGLEQLLSRRKDARGKKIVAQAVGTSGSADNCRLVDQHEVDFAFVQNDIAHMAHHGTGLFERHVPLARIRALCSLYPEAVQIVARTQSGIATLDDLRGKRINVGLEGSGMRINAIQVLKAAGIGLGELGEVRGTNRQDAMQELAQGRVDALFVTSAYPAPGLLRLATTQPIRLVPLPPEAAEELHRRYPFFVPVRIPRNTYPDMEKG